MGRNIKTSPEQLSGVDIDLTTAEIGFNPLKHPARLRYSTKVIYICSNCHRPTSTRLGNYIRKKTTRCHLCTQGSRQSYSFPRETGTIPKYAKEPCKICGGKKPLFFYGDRIHCDKKECVDKAKEKYKMLRGRRPM